MAPKTIKQAIVETLEDLSQKNLEKFTFTLRDRRGEPRIRRTDLEDKSILEISDFVVSVFTEKKALSVVVETLRQINCNEEADRLESENKAFVDRGDPALRKTSTGELNMEPSQDARKAVTLLNDTGNQGLPVKKQEEMEAEAKARVVSEGGDPGIAWLILSRFVIQFGKYKGQTFKWLLENDVGYTAYLVADHQEHRKHQDPLMANKDSLTKYAMAYPEVSKVIRGYRGLNGEALVGFGRYPLETLRGLYESKEPEKVSYVDFLRTMKSHYNPMSKMAAAVRYTLRRDQEKSAAAARRKRYHSSRGRSSTRSSVSTRKRQKRSYRKSSFY